MARARQKPTPADFGLPAPPPQTVVSESDRETFRKGEQVATAETAAEAAAATAAATAKRTSSKLRRVLPEGQEPERVVLSFPPDLAKRLRDRCHNERRSVSDGAAEAVEAWLAASR